MTKKAPVPECTKSPLKPATPTGRAAQGSGAWPGTHAAVRMADYRGGPPLLPRVGAAFAMLQLLFVVMASATAATSATTATSGKAASSTWSAQPLTTAHLSEPRKWEDVADTRVTISLDNSTAGMVMASYYITVLGAFRERPLMGQPITPSGAPAGQPTSEPSAAVVHQNFVQLRLLVDGPLRAFTQPPRATLTRTSNAVHPPPPLSL